MVFSAAAAVRRAASSSALLFARAAGRTRLNHHSPAALLRRPPTTDGLLFRSALGSRSDLGFSPQRSHFSSTATKPAFDPDLIDVIESEIKCAQECDDLDRVEETPKGFPFEILDEEGTNTITLKRNYHDENIEVVVSMPILDTGEEPEKENEPETDAQDESIDESPSQSSIPLTITVDKGKGKILEFECTAYSDEVVIDAISVKERKDADQEMIAYEGPDFGNLDENLQKAFHKYLEMRGITTITANFLHEYMINKDNREYLLWLQNLKQFIEK